MAAAVQCAASQAWPRYSQRKLPGQQCRAFLGGLTYLPSSECPSLFVGVKDTDVGFESRSPRLQSRSQQCRDAFHRFAGQQGRSNLRTTQIVTCAASSQRLPFQAQPALDAALTLLYPSRRLQEQQARPFIRCRHPRIGICECILKARSIAAKSTPEHHTPRHTWTHVQEAAAYFEMARLINLLPSCILVYLGAWVRE